MKLQPDWLHAPSILRLTGSFANARQDFRFVGGCVRDSLLARPFSDWDVATPAAPDAVMQLLNDAQIKAIPTGIEHGTVTARIGTHHIEITTLRRDVVTQGRRAKVAYTDDWREDAARRDFTMNALTMDSSGEIYDYFGGIEDAKRGIVRFIGDAPTRIREDYLRILRFFRFSAHYAHGIIEEKGKIACADHAAGLAILSGERIARECFKLLQSNDCMPTLQLMAQHEMGQHIGWEVMDIATLSRLQHCPYAPHSIHPLMKLAALMSLQPEAIHSMMMRWKLSNPMKRELKALAGNASAIHPQMSLAQQKHALRKWEKEAYISAVQLAYAKSDMAAWSSFAPLMTMVGWNAPHFPLTGQEVKDASALSGKALGDTLKRLEKLWEESDYRLSKDDLLRLI